MGLDDRNGEQELPASGRVRARIQVGGDHGGDDHYGDDHGSDDHVGDDHDSDDHGGDYLDADDHGSDDHGDYNLILVANNNN